jgi:glyoxylate reductase
MELLARSCRMRLWEKDRPLPRERLLEMAAGVEGILCLLSDPMGKDVLDAAGPSLKAISTMAVGYDNIDVEEATRRRIPVGNTPGVLTEATADFTFALMLAVSRRVVEGDRLVREGKFLSWGPTLLVGGDFHGRTLGVIGMGRIGQAVAKRALGFGMKIVYFNRHRLSREKEVALGVEFVELPELIARSDYISIHCPLNRESRHLIGPAEIAAMKPTAYLINAGRGPVVDEAALVAALQAKKIAGAAFDVYEREPQLSPGLDKLDNAVLAPHAGSASAETRNRMAVMAVQNLVAGLKGEPMPWPVNHIE